MLFEEFKTEETLRRFDHLKYNYGQMISHYEMRHILQLPEKMPTQNVPADEAIEQHEKFAWELLRRVDLFKIILSERKMALRNKKGTGFEIIRPNEHAEYAIDLINKGVKKAFDKSQNVLNVTNITLLSVSERSQHAEIAARISALAEHMVEDVDKLVLHEEARKLSTPE